MPDNVVSLDQARQADLERVLAELLDAWEVPAAARAALVGAGESAASRLERASHLLAIHRATLTMYPRSRVAADTWVHAANPYFEGRTPLELMLEPGLAGLRRVVEHVNSSSPWGA